jgi:hypothetical protein
VLRPCGKVIVVETVVCSGVGSGEERRRGGGVPDEVLNAEIALDVSSSPNVENMTRLEENPSAQKLACWISSGVRVPFD